MNRNILLFFILVLILTGLKVLADDGNFHGSIQATDITSSGGKFWGDGSQLTNLPAGAVTSSSGSFTRAANASGTQTISLGFTPSMVIFSVLDDSVSSVYSDGWDDGTIAISSSANSTALGLLSALIAGPGLKSHTESIYLSTYGGDGWSGHITTKASNTIITFTKLGNGRAMTIKYLAIK